MESLIGKVCPFCKTELKDGDTIKICPACGIAHHEECWKENNGCSTFGCSEQHYVVPTSTASSATTNRFCIKCGAAISQGENFCKKCGTSVLNAQGDMASTFITNKTPEESNSHNKLTIISQIKANPVPYVFAIIGLVLFLIGIIYQVPSREFSFYGI